MIKISEPQIPEKDLKGSIVDLLESIALEEAALAHFINAEAEKVQSISKMIDKDKICFKEILLLQKSIAKSLRLPIKKQILLQFKLEDILEFKSKMINKKKKDC